MKNIFENAPSTTAKVTGKGSTSNDLTDTVSNTLFVEFTDAEGKPSRGSQDYPLNQHCSLEQGDEVPIVYVPYSENFDKVTAPFVRLVTGMLKGMLRLVGLKQVAETVDEMLEEDTHYEHYVIKIENFEDYLS